MSAHPHAIEAAAGLPNPRCLRDRRLIDVFDRYAGVGSGRRVLEIGRMRSGWSSFLERERGCEVTGAVPAGLPDDQFDLVFSMGVLDRLERPFRHLKAISRLVRPGGRVLTIVPNLRAWNRWLQRLGSASAEDGRAMYDPASLRALHDIAGFRTVACGHIGFFVSLLSAHLYVVGIRRARCAR